MSRTTVRPVAAALSLVVVLAVTALALAAPASAAAYRYWGYFQLQGTSWSFATTGADQSKPADGAVEGWRFAVAGETDARLPRVTATFEDVCGPTPSEAGRKRVAVVIDYGRAADTEDGATPPAPVAECAVVDTAATGAEVLAAVAEVRGEGAMVCGIDNHPTTGCGGEVKEVTPEAQAADTPVSLEQPSPTGTASPTDTATDTDDQTAGGETADGGGSSYAGLVAVLLAAVAVALVALRRRRGQL